MSNALCAFFFVLFFSLQELKGVIRVMLMTFLEMGILREEEQGQRLDQDWEDTLFKYTIREYDVRIQ